MTAVPLAPADIVQAVSRVDPIVPGGLEAFDHLATMVCVVTPDGRCLFANSAFEEVLGLSRRAVVRESIYDWVVAPALLKDVVSAVARNEYATSTALVVGTTSSGAADVLVEHANVGAEVPGVEELLDKAAHKKPPVPAAASAPCADPGPFAYTPPAAKPIEAAGAHSPPGTASSPPSTTTPAASAPKS